MSTKAHRQTDVNNGDGAVTDTTPNTTVFINNLLASIDGSQVSPHRHNNAQTADGSETVFVHNTRVNFQGNIDTCGDIRAEGSEDVFVSAAGISYLTDNTLNFGVTPPTGMQTYTSPFVQYVAEHDDPESADPPGTLEPGVLASTPIPNTIEQDPQQPPKTAPTQDCTDIDALPNDFQWQDTGMEYNDWAGSVALSPNFTVFDLTTGPAVSTWILANNVGLTQKQILQNLCFLAKTALEPIKAQYSGMIITSGFRAKAGGSQHNKGQAVDIQVPGFSGQEYWDGAHWIRDNISYDQFILEYGGRNPWFHVSTNSSGHRGALLTYKGRNIYVPGLERLA